MINVFFRHEEIHGAFLVSLYSPVNCIACRGLDISIINVGNVIRGTVVAFAVAWRQLHEESIGGMVKMQMSNVHAIMASDTVDRRAERITA